MANIPPEFQQSRGNRPSPTTEGAAQFVATIAWARAMTSGGDW